VQDSVSAHDSVWLAVKHGGDVCWFALYGDAADGVDRTEMKTAGSHGLTRETTIAELFSTLHGHDAVHPEVVGRGRWSLRKSGRRDTGLSVQAFIIRT